jgi:enamidase
MAAPATTAVIGIGTLFTGELKSPRADVSRLLIAGGRIAAWGEEVDAAAAERVIDVQGATVAPGLIDSHCHVVLGDFTPRQNTVGFLASYVHGGITSVISPGEIHAPGRPRDAAGVKALAILAQRSWRGYRPNGMKVHGGAIVIEPTLSEGDLREVAREGVRLAKYGFGAFRDPLDGAPQIRAAQAAGIRVMCHSGGASLPGSKPITADHLIELRPDVCGHLNGGPTSLDDEGVRRLIRETDLMLQVVQAGNLRSALMIVEEARRSGAEGRIIIGSDTPTGTGVMPLGVLKTIAELCSLGGVEPDVAWAWASGVTSAFYGLEGGVLAPGRPADLVVLDAPWGSLARDAAGALRRGDIPGISAVLIDGVPRALRSRNTPLATRAVLVRPEMDEPAGSGHV